MNMEFDVNISENAVKHCSMTFRHGNTPKMFIIASIYMIYLLGNWMLNIHKIKYDIAYMVALTISPFPQVGPFERLKRRQWMKTKFYWNKHSIQYTAESAQLNYVQFTRKNETIQFEVYLKKHLKHGR